jgi:putative ABC transport system permease protein
MTIQDTLHETYSALSANKIRSGLTMLGIIIGISSVIAMVSIGQGAQTSIQASIQSIGSNLIMVYPGAQRAPGAQVSTGRGQARTLVTADADAIKKDVTGVKEVASELSGRYQVTSKGKNTNTSVVGVTPSYTTVRNLEIEEGNFVSTGLAKTAVIGPTVKTDLFADADPIGQAIRIKGIEFKVIGVTKAKGGSGFGSQDDMIFIPLSSAQKFLAGDDYVSTISVQGTDADTLTALQQNITDVLLERHKIKDPTAADYLEMLVAYLLRELVADGKAIPYHMLKFMEKN